MLIGLEFRLQRLSEAHRLGGDHVLQRPALGAGENGLVDGLRVLLPAQDHAAPGTPQGLVGGGGHEIRIGHGAGMLSRRHQPGDVGHVHHQQRASLIGDLPQLREVDGPGIGAGAGHQDLRPAFQGDPPDLLIVDHLGLRVHPVRHEVEVGAAHVHRAAMGQMPAVGKAHAHDGVPGLRHGEIHRHVGLGAAVGLHVGVLRAEEPAGPVPGQVLRHVHKLASPVVPLSRISFCILVGQAGSHGGQHRRGNKILAGDQFDVGPLPVQLQLNGLCDFGISAANQIQFHPLSS